MIHYIQAKILMKTSDCDTVSKYTLTLNILWKSSVHFTF